MFHWSVCFPRDGVSKCGLYCSLAFCCDQLHSEQEVDIFHAARIVKKNRPQLVNTLVRWLTLYELQDTLGVNRVN